MEPRVSSDVVLAGVATLFVELTLIRYVPGQIRVLGYFTNFVLLAAFLGFGLGMLAWRRWPGPALSWCAPLALVVSLLLAGAGGMIEVGGSTGQFLFLEYSELDWISMPLHPFLALSFTLLAATFVPLGHFVGGTLAGDAPLRRYALNITGSLLGILAFTACAALGLPPWVWVGAAALLTLAPLRLAPMGWRLAGVASVIVAIGLSFQATRDATWSPYQKITTGPVTVLDSKGVVQEWQRRQLDPERAAQVYELPKERGFTVRVNDDSYQTPLDLSDESVALYPGLQPLQNQYDLPFTFRESPGEVLVLGAGTGNDVAAALRAGATRVDAVEIDPVILQHGRDLHPEQPYADPRVTVHVTDARSFLARTDRRYDMIVYGLLDSHVLLSSKSNLRLDSFVFTRESFALAYSRLVDDGLMVVSHAVSARFFYRRMRSTLEAAVGKAPVVASSLRKHPLGIVYLTGPRVPPGESVDEPTVLEDDWPFVYLAERKVPRDYLLAMAMMAAVTLVSVRGVTGRRWSGVDPHFFALGVGFLLLETRGIAVLSVLIGSTWAVNAVIFAGVLVMALGSTLWVSRRPSTGLPRAAYLFLFLFLAANAAVETGTLAAMPAGVGILIGAALLSAPLFASGVVFASSLDRTGDADRALASNLLGALAGGLIEYLSMSSGLRYLLLPAAFAYLLAVLLDHRSRQ